MPRGFKRVPKENGITLSMILITLFSFLLILFLTIPNIYFDNNIYYQSREIAHYESIAQTLREEQSIIKHKLEEVKYQENIVNQNI